MNLLIFKTNIKSKRKVSSLKPYFNTLSSIINWTVDVQDIDKVLRIEALESLKEQDVIYLMKTQGFYCETLND
jgi:hypothetical protein